MTCNGLYSSGSFETKEWTAIGMMTSAPAPRSARLRISAALATSTLLLLIRP
jgi:hypothetical protein